MHQTLMVSISFGFEEHTLTLIALLTDTPMIIDAEKREKIQNVSIKCTEQFHRLQTQRIRYTVDCNCYLDDKLKIEITT